MPPVTVKIPVEGSYSSAVLMGMTEFPMTTEPPAIKTRPSGSSVAVCPNRAVFILRVEVKVPGDCARAIVPWPATPNKRSGRTKLGVLIFCWFRLTASPPNSGSQVYAFRELRMTLCTRRSVSEPDTVFQNFD